MTREQKNKHQREQRALNGNYHTKKYEKTEKGFLVRTYRNMLSRVSGVTKNKNHLYFSPAIICKITFIGCHTMVSHFQSGLLIFKY